MKKMLLATVVSVGALIAAVAPSSAATILAAGVNPTGVSGQFLSGSTAANGAFVDEVLFTLTGPTDFRVAATATNTFISTGGTNYIQNFQAAVYNDIGILGRDIETAANIALGPVAAQIVEGGQQIGLAGILAAGNYFLEFTGIGQGTASFQGSVVANPVPLPGALALMGTGLLGGIALMRRRRQKAALA